MKLNFIHKKTTIIITLMIMGLMIIGCAKEVTQDAYDQETDEINTNTINPKIQVEMMDGGIMVFELYPEYAPETVENFVGLVESGFYDGLKFHRIMKNFMVQSGDPLGNGTGGSGKTIKGEFSKNGFAQNTLKHEKGVLSMARSQNMDSASSQFFIMDGEAASLDGSYAAFGMLIEGIETLERIANTSVEKILKQVNYQCQQLT